MFVLTIDQQASTRDGDHVPNLLERLIPVTTALEGVALPFERTVGDEVQALLTSAADTLTVVRHVLRIGGWSIGLGIGSVDTPLPNSSRAASGPAFVHAREAVQRAKTKSTMAALAVHADKERTAREVESLLVLLGAVIGRRTDLGWEVVDALGARQPSNVTGDQQTGSKILDGPESGDDTALGEAESHEAGAADREPARTQKEVANVLGITRQAVNQRLKTSLWAEESAVLPLAERLLAEADGGDLSGTEHGDLR